MPYFIATLRTAFFYQYKWCYCMKEKKMGNSILLKNKNYTGEINTVAQRNGRSTAQAGPCLAGVS